MIKTIKIHPDLPQSWNWGEFVAVALALGMLTGTVEGLASLTARHYREPEIIWTAGLSYGFLFSFFGLSLASVYRFRTRWIQELGLGLMLMFAFSDWLRGNIATAARMGGIPLAVQGLAIILASAILSWLSIKAMRRWQGPIARNSFRVAVCWIGALVLCALSIHLWRLHSEQVATKHLSLENHSKALENPAKANVVVIIVDTLRADHLTAYGYSRNTTPNLSDFARNGVVFENAISPSSWTLPSHASMFTGRMPDEHGATGLQSVLDRRYVTIGEAFQKEGYTTAAFSANTFFVTRSTGLDRGFIHFEDRSNKIFGILAPTFAGQELGRLLYYLGYPNNFSRENAHEINGQALSWLESATHPFFMVLNYFDVHDPYFSPPHFKHFSATGNPGRLALSYNDIPHLSQNEIQRQLDAYDDSILYVDHEIKMLVDKLRSRGLADNTVFAITSDHGEFFGEHGLLVHANGLYRPVVHVPLIIWSAHGVPENLRISAPVSTVNLGATLLDLASTHSADFPGISLAKYWRGFSPTSGDAISELDQIKLVKQWPAFYGPTVSLMTPEWHYLYNQHQGIEMYRWVEDPSETNNLARNPLLHSTLEALAKRTTALTHGFSEATPPQPRLSVAEIGR